MRIDSTKDLECHYRGVMDYITSLEERMEAGDTIPDRLKMYIESKKELLTCSKRDWPVIKQAQSHMGISIVERLIEDTYKCSIEELIKKSAGTR